MTPLEAAALDPTWCLLDSAGMEVEGREWLSFMSMDRVATPARTQRRGQA